MNLFSGMAALLSPKYTRADSSCTTIKTSKFYNSEYYPNFKIRSDVMWSFICVRNLNRVLIFSLSL
jgi:hypothetical protein